MNRPIKFLMACSVWASLGIGVLARPARAAGPPGPIWRVDVTRWVLSHGRTDRLRPAGIWTPENPKGAWVTGISTRAPEIAHPPPPLTLAQIYALRGTVLEILPQLPDRFRVTLGLDADGRTTPPAPGRGVHPLVGVRGTNSGGTILPSGFTLVVAELANRRAPGPGIDWCGPGFRFTKPRFGKGNFYATVSIPGTGILRGQELVTKEQFAAYTANSILYESPDIPWQVTHWSQHGGTTPLKVLPAPAGNLPPPRPPNVPLPPRDPPPKARTYRMVSWANPLELMLTEVRRALQPDGRVRVWIQGRLPRSFEPNPTFRVAVEATSGTQVFDTVANPFFITLPVPGAQPDDYPDDWAQVTAVASAWGFVAPPPAYAGVTPFVQRPPQQTVGFTTFHSGGCTLGDKIRVDFKPDTQAGGGAHVIERSLCILFDASGSMKEDNKIDKAKASARAVLSRLGPETEVALIVFYDCKRIVLEQEFTTDVSKVLAILPRIRPTAGTPLADGTKFASDYMQKNASGKKLQLIILSDGKETCRGDPIKAAREASGQ